MVFYITYERIEKIILKMIFNITIEKNLMTSRRNIRRNV